ncbi:GlsB/YeaQ/YmgE family stress response membrane protein [Actinomadura sp. HBU206391]|uniref:GlsB/YeaQ/YmgE family stress response membrane protein n=1 Tax=Actinomadura sp. HBU206391 TaxID=2731692 RepID=UPI001650829D|nr:GlsB/YeaQ/YmgE family stress response membrane protein [Actinomadura sp. HBU206391]MBC6459120.1 GlsB/YeaQ/YmgE family stress response membrane protein [Actinomadura sp. HBU206391]
MSIIAWIILGLVAGMVARMLVPGKDPQGLVITTLIGVAGALLGGFLATQLFDVDGVQGFFNLSTWITAIAGAAVLLLAYHLVTGQNSGRRSGRWAGRR